jgi:hypothetical protein
MAYIISKSDGTTLTINDGQINTESHLQLIGRNRADYGTPIAQNMFRLLENFAAEDSPDNNEYVNGTSPVPGQLWYRPSDNTLHVYNATSGWTAMVSFVPGQATAIANLDATEATIGTLDVTGTLGVSGLSTLDSVDVTNNMTVGGTLTVATITAVGGIVEINNQLDVAVINIGNSAYVLDNESIGTVALPVPDGHFTEISSATIKAGSYESTTPSAAVSIPNGLLALGAGVETNALVSRSNTATIGGLWATNGFTLNGGGEFGGDWDIKGTWTVDGAIVLGTGTVEANYADIAERFRADQDYVPGTVVAIGGDREVTHTTSAYSADIFGIVADNPAFILNNKTQDLEFMPAITLVGRTPVRVIGKVSKGDRLTSSATPGVAMAADTTQLTMFNYIGRALEDKSTDDESLIWAAFGAK